MPRGWIPSNSQTFATIIDPAGVFAIVVAAGDQHTGLRDRTHSTRSEKGPATRNAIGTNQMAFAEIDPSYPWPRVVIPKRTWFLLYYLDEDADEIRIELSLPAAMTGDGHVTAWRERRILQSVGPGVWLIANRAVRLW